MRILAVINDVKPGRQDQNVRTVAHAETVLRAALEVAVLGIDDLHRDYLIRLATRLAQAEPALAELADSHPRDFEVKADA